MLINFPDLVIHVEYLNVYLYFNDQETKFGNSVLMWEALEVCHEL